MKKPKNNPEGRVLLSVALAVGAFAVLFALVMTVESAATYDPAVIVPLFVSFLSCTGLALVAIVVFAGIIKLLSAFLDWSAIRTAINIAAHRISFKIAANNAGAVYPYIQSFLYFVLSQNREFLHLPLGKDASCLAPAGYSPAYRSGCVFYRFHLIAPEKPDMDIPLLRQIIQSYIVAEAQNYGINGLPPVFQSKAVGTMPSVFLDRLYYDEGMHFIGFDVLYIDNENAAVYARKAIMREAALKQPEAEVTDADL